MNEEAELKIGAKTKILQGEAEPEPEASLGHREQKLREGRGRKGGRADGKAGTELKLGSKDKNFTWKRGGEGNGVKWGKWGNWGWRDEGGKWG